jgi:hypothetical protein
VGETKPVLEFVLLMGARLVETLVQRDGQVLVVERALVGDSMRSEDLMRVEEQVRVE